MSEKKKRKIDGYAKAKRNKITQSCIVYAKKRAVEWLGPTAWHQCDESCDHQAACEGCKSYNPSEDIPLGVVGETCLRE